MSSDPRILSDEELEIAKCAIVHGVTVRGFDGPDGVTQDEALAYAAPLFDHIAAITEQRDKLKGFVSHIEDNFLKGDPNAELLDEALTTAGELAKRLEITALTELDYKALERYRKLVGE